MPVENIGVFKEAHTFGQPAPRKGRSKDLPRKHGASRVVRDDGESRDLRLGQQHIIEAEKARINWRRVLHLEQALNCILTTRDPYHVNLGKDTSDAIKTGRDIAAEPESCGAGPIKPSHITFRHAYVEAFDMPDAGQERLHLRVREIARLTEPLGVETVRKCFESDVPFNIEASLACDVQLQRISLCEELHLILTIFRRLGTAKHFFKVGVGNEQRWRAIVEQEAQEGILTFELAQICL